ncbi:hypothetical protein N0V83_001471 [Neocucurbitaria cava]|uniref:Uncharacterized protein n=1 Tax=Neocucurbitaria cava TaxID=798079 RepID=A0A9W8YFR5_9PLEO|nr:hypothetical protein N0V83_001471 [Neocucurbitaria cava]
MYRNLASASIRAAAPARFIRPFTVSASRPVKQYPNDLSTDDSVKTDAYPDDKHATEKAKEGDTHNVQESNAKAGMDSAHKEGTGGHATEGRDAAGGKETQKKEFPEAPDSIGMQDERGGRGG